MLNRMKRFGKLIARLLDALYRWDAYTLQHSHRVAVYSALIARNMNFNAKALKRIFYGALLHDMGKIGIKEKILRKPGLLLPEERLEIMTHPVIGARILSSRPVFAGIIPMVLFHHEKIDGSGYPFGLRGDAIPIEARIIATADTFDALTTDRPYRRGMTFRSAAHWLESAKFLHLDAVTVEHFHPVIKELSITAIRGSRNNLAA